MTIAEKRIERMAMRLPHIESALEDVLRCNQCKVCRRHRIEGSRQLTEARHDAEWTEQKR